MTGVAESVLPLAIDTFAVAAGIGFVTDQARLLPTGALLSGAAWAIPLLGFIASPGVRSLASRADAIAMPLLFAVAIYALAGSERKRSPDPILLVALLGVGAAMNAVQVGAADLPRLAVAPVAFAVLAQAGIVAALGLRAGRLVIERSGGAGFRLTGLGIAAGGAGALLLGMHLGS